MKNNKRNVKNLLKNASKNLQVLGLFVALALCLGLFPATSTANAQTSQVYPDSIIDSDPTPRNISENIYTGPGSESYLILAQAEAETGGYPARQTQFANVSSADTKILKSALDSIQYKVTELFREWFSR